MSRSPARAEEILEQDRFEIRTLEPSDAPSVHRIDRRITGRERRGYLEHRIAEALMGSNVCASLVALEEHAVVGFLLATVYYGEFGLPEPAAVIDTIGVDPDFRGRGVASALVERLVSTLAGLGVGRLQTNVSWDAFDLLPFLARMGFAPSGMLCLEKKIDRTM